MVDSNSDKVLLYDKSNLIDKSYYSIYFKHLNVLNVNDLISKYNIEILSYVIDDKKYYITNNNIEELISKYTIDMNNEEKYNYEINGFYIDAINVISDVNNLIEIEKEYHIY